MIGADQAVDRDGEALHALLRYDSPESLCARAVPYVREGLARGEAVIAVVSAEVEQVLRSALGDDAAAGALAGRGRLLRASGCDVRRVPAVPRRAARRRGAHAAARPERRAGHRGADGGLSAVRGHGQRGLPPVRLPLGLPLRHPRPLPADAAPRQPGPPPAARTRWPRDPQRRLPRAQRLPRPVRAAATATGCGAARPPGDRSGPACGVPAPAAPVGRPARDGRARRRCRERGRGRRSPTPSSTGPRRCGCGPGRPTGWPGCTSTTAA